MANQARDKFALLGLTTEQQTLLQKDDCDVANLVANHIMKIEENEVRQ